MIFLYLFFIFANSEKFIKNINVNPCRKCIHYNSIYNDYSLSNCKKFGEKNIISNEITYEYADSCRDDESKCGKEGKYFEEDKYANLKILQQKIVNKLPITISVFLIIFSMANIVQN